MSIKKNQTKLRIQRTLGVDITNCKEANIRYITPSGNKGEWTATVSNAAQGVIHYDVVSTDDLNEAGEWRTWGHIVFDDDREAEGDVVLMTVKKAGEK